jgi:hypothetical protein
MLGVPLLIIPFAIYNIAAFLLTFSWDTKIWPIPLTTGETVTPTAGDAIVAGSILLLLIEMVRAARVTRGAFMDHILSLLLFIGMTVEFLMVPQVATVTFLLLLVISFVDAVGGFAIAMRAAPRRVAVTEVQHVHPA